MSDKWKGVALPWNDTIKGTIDPKEDSEVLKSSVLWILLTRKGERVMLPEFGSNVLDMVFEQGTEKAVASFSAMVRNAIATWEDRINLLDVKTEFQDHSLRCEILFLNEEDPLDNTPKVSVFQITPDGEIL